MFRADTLDENGSNEQAVEGQMAVLIARTPTGSIAKYLGLIRHTPDLFKAQTVSCYSACASNLELCISILLSLLCILPCK
jgi:hypothetical protein